MDKMDNVKIVYQCMYVPVRHVLGVASTNPQFSKEHTTLGFVV